MSRREFTIRQDGHTVILIVDGRLIADLPWDAALELSLAIYIKAKAAEEIAKAAGIIQDQALLIRIGAPVGLTDNPDIQAEAAKEAAWNKDLRRYLPGGVKSKEQVGTPSIIQHPPGKARR